MKKFDKQYNDIISVENLLLAWQEFLCGKRKKKDVCEFQLKLMDNIFDLHNDLKNKTYRHGEYKAFKINDPKPRDIHKASVRDRLLHHAIYRVLYLYFDNKFIHDSYSCRVYKGTHRAINRFRYFSRIVSKNNTKTCFVLKCDIKKFFASIDHDILKSILKKHIEDEDILWLLGQIIDSFQTKTYIRDSVNMQNNNKKQIYNPIYAIAEMNYYTSKTRERVIKNFPSKYAIAQDDGKGLPLGNLTSQLLVNIYMNEFDQFVKRELKVKYYIRYADDFVIFSEDRKYLEKTLGQMKEFLNDKLKLSMHPDKVFIKTLSSGVDFLGWVNFPRHRVLRTATKNRMFRNINKDSRKEVIQSYLGMLSYGNGYKLEKDINLHIL